MAADQRQPEVMVTHRGIITISAMAATLMQALDSTIANVALPYMQGSFSTSYEEITWVLTSYVIAAAIMTAPVGWLSARFGQKRVYLVSIIGFTVASMACGVAGTITQMVLYRLVQGVFGAALVPLSQATMMNIYPAEKRGAAMALWGMGVMVGPILGPTLGGYLTDWYNWRYVFFVNLPFGIASTIGLWLFLPGEKAERGLRFDWFGFTALAFGIGALQLVLDRGEIKDWFSSTEVIVEAVVAAAGFYLFLVHMVTGEKPFITPAVFRDRNFSAGLVAMFAMGMVLLASSAVLAPWLQVLGGYPVDIAGILLAPRGMGTMLAMMIAGRIADRIDPRVLIAFGVALMWWSLNRLSTWTPAVDETTLFVNTVIQGIGMGFVFIPLTVVSFATLPARLRYEGTALFSLLRNIGSAIGISVFETLLSTSTRVEHAALAPYSSPLNRALASTPGVAQALSPHTPHGAALLDSVIDYQAQVVAYNNDYWLMALLALPILALLPLMRRPRGAPAGGGAHAAID
ncbi:MAG: DHA2 family efflux MFS transporter permease subunit [Rhodospirillales bacterium]|jgi:DHA2 family multidrug resistance protein|nr:DHA2 family efflux MFS transporter permease subunit [Rhodospirillales bacterium]